MSESEQELVVVKRPKLQLHQPIWEQFLQEKAGFTYDDSLASEVYLNKDWEVHWYDYREEKLKSLTTELHSFAGLTVTPTEQKKNPLMMASSSKAKTQTELDEDNIKVMKKLALEPGDFDRQRHNFETWWLSMQSFLRPYEGCDDYVRINGTLARMQKGEAAVWAKIKLRELVDTKLNDWKKFTEELLERFSDHAIVQKAANDLHNYVHKPYMSLILYLDKFETLKYIGKVPDEMALTYLHRGLSVTVLEKLFGTPTAMPDNYADFLKQVRAYALNRETVWNYHQSLTRPNIRQSWYPTQDKRTGTGTTYGGHGRPMEEIGQANIKCFECGQIGHMAQSCPKKKKGTSNISRTRNSNKSNSTCFNCNKLGHWSKDCPEKRQELKKKAPKSKFKKRFRKKGRFTRQVNEKLDKRNNQETKSLEIKNAEEDLADFWETRSQDFVRQSI
jgi:hypothetical protein